jgi:dynein heavy chain
MPTPIFPVPVLQSGIKITNEPPKGLKSNLARSYDDLSEEVYNAADHTEKMLIYKRLLFALAFFHAVILQRRKFGPIGWNIPYEWMDSDFQVSREQLYMYLTSQPGIPLRTLNYMVAECNYGGRVTDDKDVRLICAILTRYFCSDAASKDHYKLSSLDCYFIPPGNSTLSEVKQFIKDFPLG